MSTKTKKQPKGKPKAPSTVEQTPRTTTVDTINGRAVLARVVISVWSGRKFDRKASNTFNDEHTGSRDAGRYHKHLFGGAKESASHSKVLSAAGSVRLTHYDQTLPWSDDGWRLLPCTNYWAYTEAILKEKDAYEAAVRAFLDEYPALCQKAKGLLKELYRDEDYPDVKKVAKRFGISVEYQPIPAKGDFRMDLPADQIAQIEQQTQQRIAETTQTAMQDAWRRLHEVVTKVKTKLADPEGIFRDSLIGNVKEMTTVLSRLNVTGDEHLEAMRARVADELATLNPDGLRKDKTQRTAAVRKADQILDAMKALYGGGEE